MDSSKIIDHLRMEVRRITGIDDLELQKSPERIQDEAFQRKMARVREAISRDLEEQFRRMWPQPAVKFEYTCWPPKPPACGCTGSFHTCNTIT